MPTPTPTQNDKPDAPTTLIVFAALFFCIVVAPALSAAVGLWIR